MQVEARGVIRLALGAAAAIVALTPARPVRAHGERPDLSQYGGLGASSARCQRVISGVTAQCIAQVLDARQRCLMAQLDGLECDTSAVDASVQASRQRSRALVGRFCTELEVAMLGFEDVPDAQEDVAAACSEAEVATLSAVYGPAMVGGSVGSVDTMPRTCMAIAGQQTARLLRFATRARRRAFDRIVRDTLSVSQKESLLARAERAIEHARNAARQRIETACPDADFNEVYGRDVDTFLAAIDQRADCFTGSTYVQAVVTCPPPVCGNGLQEPGEACDDGNAYDADACHNDCTTNDCQVFASTFDLIQQAIFESHGCTNDLCHGEARQGDLDLRRGSSYANLVDVPSVASLLKRVEPGDEERSLLWLKLAAATLQRPGVPGSPMPQGLPPLSEGELEALRLWIYSGAPEHGAVRGTAELLNACLPAPEPIEIRPPIPPPPGTGVQLHMALWVLPPNSESEVCFASYYDFTDQVPPEFLSADGKMFRFNRQLTTQNPLSHHLVTQFYRGESPPDDPVWGTYVCRGGPHDGEGCEPTALRACGPNTECATTPVKSVACIGFGPLDAQTTISGLGFGGTQETVADVRYAPGVYAELPVKGVAMWNSHGFNLDDTAGKLEAWINYYFAPPDEQQYPVHEILNVDQVFGMNVPPFTTEEICNIDVVPTGAQLFELSSHMHQRGKRFQIFRGAFRCAGGLRSGAACSPIDSDMCEGAPCTADSGGGTDSLLYTSLIYNDPVVLRLEPPLDMSGTAAERSLTYCAMYDNGFTEPTTVKRRSTSPPPPFPIPGFGGPCAQAVACVSGQPEAPCRGRTDAERDASCDSMPGAGDGFCDACVLTGGVTTDDEMFVLLGSYFVP